MKKTLTVLLLFSALSLCGLSVVQWLREAELRDEIKSLTFQLQTETQLRIETQEKAAAFELEITRLTQLRADTEAKLLAVTEELTLTQTDQLQRGVSIALLSNEYAQARSQAQLAEQRLAETTAAIANRNEDVTGQNTAITTANDRLKKLTAERDAAIEELNTRTKAFNELVTKYNKLVK